MRWFILRLTLLLYFVMSFSLTSTSLYADPQTAPVTIPFEEPSVDTKKKVEGDILEFLGFNRNSLEYARHADQAFKEYMNVNFGAVKEQAANLHVQALFVQTLTDTIRFYGGYVLLARIGGKIFSAIKHAFFTMARAMLEAITKKKFDERMLVDFKESKKEYDKVKLVSMKLEGTLDFLLRLMDEREKKSLAKGNRDNFQSLKRVFFLDELNRWINSLNYRQDILKESVDDKDLLLNNPDKWKECRKEFNLLDTIIEDFNKIKETIESEKEENFCQKMKDLFHENIMLKSALEKFRSDILAAKEIFFRHFQKLKKEKGLKFLHTLKNTKDFKSVIKEHYQFQKRMLEKRKKLWVNTCLSRFLEKSICLNKFELEEGDNYKVKLQSIHDELQVLLVSHKEYEENIAKNIFSLRKNPELSILHEEKLLSTIFEDLLKEQREEFGIPKQLKQKRAIEKYCGKLEEF